MLKLDTLKHSILIQTYSQKCTIAALVYDNIIVDIICDFMEKKNAYDSIYSGVVVNDVESLSAYFVNYGDVKNGFLPYSACLGKLSVGDRIIVQIMRPPNHTKGARLSQFVKIKNLADESFFVPYQTKAEYDSTINIKVHENQTWTNVVSQYHKNQSNGLLYQRPCHFEEFLYKYSDVVDEVYIDAFDARAFEIAKTCKNIFKTASINLNKDLLPVYEKFYLHNQLSNVLSDKIPLESGGELFVSQTEAMVTIDVNSAGCHDSDPESTHLLVNLEAAKTSAEQIKLKNLAGLIAIDFIDMASPKSKLIVKEALAKYMSDDTVSYKIADLNMFDVLMLSRQRYGSAIQFCNNKKNVHEIILRLLSDLRVSIYSVKERASINIKCAENVYHCLFQEYRKQIVDLENRHNINLSIAIDLAVETYSISPIGAVPKIIIEYMQKIHKENTLPAEWIIPVNIHPNQNINDRNIFFTKYDFYIG